MLSVDGNTIALAVDLLWTNQIVKKTTNSKENKQTIHSLTILKALKLAV